MPRRLHRRDGRLLSLFSVLPAVAFLILSCARADAGEPPLQDAALSLVGADQGIFARGAAGTILAAVNPDRAVHPASVTKVATTLALLRRLGPAYRFRTRVYATGALSDGTVAGNLLVVAARDPFFVFENAFVVLLGLHTRGLQRVEGTVMVEGPLIFNWLPDPRGRRLLRALRGVDGATAWAAVQEERQEAAGMTLPGVAIAFGESDGVGDGERRLLVVHESAPLARIVKELNCYSNNIFHTLSAEIGGPEAVERIAGGSVGPDLRPAVVIDDAAGGGTRNRLSPRAAVAIIGALGQELERYGLTYPDVLPVAGIDHGTLMRRFEAPAYRGVLVGKTGTLGSLGVSALAGVARTRRYGEVAFAILNRGLAVSDARKRQDDFVRALIDMAGGAPWPYSPPSAPVFTEAVIERAGGSVLGTTSSSPAKR